MVMLPTATTAGARACNQGFLWETHIVGVANRHFAVLGGGKKMSSLPCRTSLVSASVTLLL